ncbi:response regulator [Paracoccus caeni]|uniref:histidine kinase n=1 Tax=Paracoccus caeni TaxID=657651 RepID=A0A934VZ96_9RHOB|nr:response regulator [Paracoccus caeni]MBK4214604.1 response regulator [Paracoccus caeni]
MDGKTRIAGAENGGDLAGLLQAELGPYRDGSRISLDGPGVALDDRAFSAVALVLHELATNAAKYGALSQPSGELRVTWSLDQAGNCCIRWAESGVAGVAPPSRSGFGSSLIERAVSFDLNGSSNVSFTADGVVAEFTVPDQFVRASTGVQPVAEAAKDNVAEDSAVDTLEGRRVLLVEDQILIAMALEAELQDFGLVVSGVAATVVRALELIASDPPDLAVLDVNLNGETAIPVAEALQARGIHFVFATGHGADVELPDGFGSVPVVSKPYQIEDILRALRKA